MSKKLLFSIMLLIIAVLLLSCDRVSPENPETEPEEIPTLVLENAYAVHPLAAPDSLYLDIYYPQNSCFLRGDEICCLAEDDADRLYYAVYNCDGAYLRTEPLPLTEDVCDLFRVYTVLPVSEDTFFYCTKANVGSQYVSDFGFADGSGKVLASGSVQANGDLECTAARENAVCIAETGICHLFSAEMKPVADISCKFPVACLQFDADGMLLAGDGCGQYLKINPADGSYETLTLSLPEGIHASCQTDTALYYSDSTGVWRDGTLLLNWSSSCLEYTHTTLLSVWDDSTMVCLIEDSILGTPYYAVLTAQTEDARRSVIPLTVSLIDRTVLDPSIEDAVQTFNRTNGRYHVILKDYSTENPLASDDEIGDRLLHDYLYGERTDIYLFGSAASFLMTDLMKKEAFLDLSAYLDDNVFPFATEQYTLNGCVRGVIIGISELNTLSTPETNVRPSLTKEDLYREAETLGNGESLFSVPINMAYDNITLMDFYDRDTKETHFASEEFYEYLRFRERLGELTDPSKGYLATDGTWKLLLADGISPAAALTSGALRYLELPITSMDNFACAKFCFGNQPFVLCGYPSSKGSYISIFCPFTFAANPESTHTDGIRAFLEFLLSDEIQSSAGWNSRHIPVTESAFRKMFTEYNYVAVSKTLLEHGRGEGLPLRSESSQHDRPEGPLLEMLLHYNTEVVFSKEEIDGFVNFLKNAHAASKLDTTVDEIVWEEVSYAENGVRSYEEAARIIDNRGRTYLNE